MKGRQMISAKIVADSICPRGNRLTTLEVIMPRYILAEAKTHRIVTQNESEIVSIESNIGFNTDQKLSKNSASSRAIRLSKMVSAVLINPFIPYAWQEDHAGMQGTKYLNDEYLFGLSEFADKAKEFFRSENKDEEVELQHIFMNLLDKPEYMGKKTLEEWWLLARDKAVECASLLNIFGLSKQICNRLLEPFMWHKVLVSATEWENFFELRCPQYKIHKSHTDKYLSWKEFAHTYDINPDISNVEKLEYNVGQADIHMMFLAEAIYDAKNESTPKQLKEGEWHIPYGESMDANKLLKLAINNQLLENKEFISDYNNEEDIKVIDEIVRKIAVVRCARVSYHIAGQGQVIDYEADLKLYDRLASSGHWSPFEHVAKVMTDMEYYSNVNGYIPTLIDVETDIFNCEVMVTGEYAEDSTKFLPRYGWCRNFRGFIQQRALMD